MIEVRRVRPEEYEDAGAVVALAYREFVHPGETDWEEYLEHVAHVAARADVAPVYVAVEHGEVIGCATLELDARIDADDPPFAPDEAEIRMLGVHPDARGRGVAKALIDACIAHAVAESRTRILVHTTTRMVAAQAMYDALGFRRLADRVFPDGFVLLAYERRVDPDVS